MATQNSTATSQSPRIVSLDQFRGYTVAGMFLVNFIGGLALVPALLDHHNTYCSYADTIMPQFLFAVGYAYRLTFLRAVQKEGRGAAVRHAVKRGLGLILIGVAIYGMDGGGESWEQLRSSGLGGFLYSRLHGEVFQALVHIGLTILWVLPVIGAGIWPRAGFVVFTALLHFAASWWFNHDLILQTPYWDGGPLGFLTWAIPTLGGSFTYDIMTSRSAREALRPLTILALLFMVLGYAISCGTYVKAALAAPDSYPGILSWLAPPPFVQPTNPVKDLWSMSQQLGNSSYLFFGTGVCFAVYALFVVLSDIGTFSLGVFRTLGQNALAAYIIHIIVCDKVLVHVPKESPLWYVSIAFCVFFGITYLFCRYLEKHRLYLRL